MSISPAMPSAPAASVDALLQYQWSVQPQAEALCRQLIDRVLGGVPEAEAFAKRLYAEAGVRFYDCVDTIFLPDSAEIREQLKAAGFEKDTDRVQTYEHVFAHGGGIFPRVFLQGSGEKPKVWLKVEHIADFVAVHRLDTEILGGPWNTFRLARAFSSATSELWAVERHGYKGHELVAHQPDARIILKHLDNFRTRVRDADEDATGFDVAGELVVASISELGVDVTCDLFFKAEREYWQYRNRAAAAQHSRQQRLGIGWANHDHHTYRCSRENFTRLVAVWEQLGLYCRERFYAGKEAGWGAQVMEQPISGIITFNDVDMSPEELLGDFSHTPMQPGAKLGTVGLWCGLHGDSFLQAGMHHLECMFDFDALKEQLEREHNIRTMKPFTDFAHLRQAFTEGERWRVSEKRMQRLLAKGYVTEEQCAKWRENGAIGSHLENLERNGGFKGFNQHGVSEIISATDPRKQAEKDAFDKVQYQTVGSH